MKTYSVWIEIEEYDSETDQYDSCDAPGAALGKFDNYQDAYKLAERITKLHEAQKDES